MGQKTGAWKSTYENKQVSKPSKEPGRSSLFPESLVLRIGVFALGYVSISIAVSHCPGTQEPGIEQHLNSDSQPGYQSSFASLSLSLSGYLLKALAGFD